MSAQHIAYPPVPPLETLDCAPASGSPSAWRLLWRWLLPARCLGCRTSLRSGECGSRWQGDLAMSAVGLGACARCQEAIYPHEAHSCPQCATPLPGVLVHWAAYGEGLEAPRAAGPCQGCRTNPPPFASARACWEYTGLVSEVLARIKYGGQLELCGPLGAMLRPWLLKGLGELGGEWRMQCVPMHRRDLHRRGFHAPELLARAALGALADERLVDALDKPRPRPAQAGLCREAREANVLGAWRVTAPWLIEGRRVVILDDVMTTGSTAREMARCLLAAGARDVHIMVVARALGESAAMDGETHAI